MDNKQRLQDLKDDCRSVGWDGYIPAIEALEAENAALLAMNADVDVGINNWIDHIEKYGADDQVIQLMRNLLERAKR